LRHSTDVKSFLAELESLENLEEDTAIFVNSNGSDSTLVLVNHGFQSRYPEKWLKQVEKLLLDDSQDIVTKVSLIRHLGHFAVKRSAHRRLLKKLFARLDCPEIAAAVVSSLAELEVPADRAWLKKLAFSNEQPTVVQAAAIRAIGEELKSDSKLRVKLTDVLTDGRDEVTRSAAARAFSILADDNQIRDCLRQLANDASEPPAFRSSCLWSLDESFAHPAVKATFEQILENEDSSELYRAAAQIYLNATIEEAIDWESRFVGIAEHALMTTDRPSPHQLYVLRSLATARFLRRQKLREVVIADAISALAEKIETSFIFGSSARNQQAQDSDIDLFILGEVSVKELSPHLRDAEEKLGKTISPVIYSRQSFVSKFQSGDPFLADVVQREKVAIIPADRTSKEIKDELRAMAAVRLGPA